MIKNTIMPVQQISSYMKFLFVLAQLGAAAAVQVCMNKHEAK